MDIRAYEYLALVNRNLERTVALLQLLENVPRLRRAPLRLAAIQIQEIRAVVSQAVTEGLNEVESERAGRLYRKRRTLEKRLQDSGARNP